MRTSDSLLRNYRYIATIVLARIKANGNFNDASLERLHSVSGFGINGVLSLMYMMIAYGMTKLRLRVRGGARGVPGGPLPPKILPGHPSDPPKFFRSLSESPTQTIDSSPCYKTGPFSGPPK